MRPQLQSLIVALALSLCALPAFAQGQQPQPYFPGVTPPVFVIPASAVSGSGTVNASLIPSADNTYDLGSSSFRWKDLWLGGVLNWSSSCLFQGAADRIDVCTGDSFKIVSGGLGVGATETGAGDIQANRSIGVGIAPSASTGVITTATGGELRYGATTKIYSGTDGLLNISSSGGTIGIQLNEGTAAPTVTSCGTGTVTTGSRNVAGQITATGATACTISFGAPNWTNTPFCVVTEVTAARALFISAASATAITVSGLTANDVFNYHCIGRF